MTIAAREPRQERSRRTQERILEAAEHLLGDKLFEQVSIQELVRSAGATTGSFYNLFGDKEALLPALYARHCRRVTALLDQLVDRMAASTKPLVALLREIVAVIVKMHLTERGLLRALVLRAHCRPVERTAQRPAEMTDVLPRLADLILKRRDEIGHPNPRRAALQGLVMVLASAREHLLYPDTTAYVVPLSPRALESELTRAFVSYLDGGRR